jgi:dihydroorotate dehydrogenase (NAD+) catalytic subunit
VAWEAGKAVKIPIIGMGNIQCAADAIEFMMAGATVVSVGTANFCESQTALHAIADTREFMRQHGISYVHEVVGSEQVAK